MIVSRIRARMGFCLLFTSVFASLLVLDLERWFPNMTRRNETTINQLDQLRHNRSRLQRTNKRELSINQFHTVRYPRVYSFGVDWTNNKKKAEDRQLQVKRVSKYGFKMVSYYTQHMKGTRGKILLNLHLAQPNKVLLQPGASRSL